ncbi:MAG: hypothetical protein ABR921_21715 [Candidatus Sulfotelmatobacter sp.]|jgi:ABC-type Mn2+/Zn2+ transport system permease subunit
MADRRQWQVWVLFALSLAGVALGIWLVRGGFAILGCLLMGVFLWRAQQFVGWILVPGIVPPDATLRLESRGQRVLLALASLLGAALCALGVYLWRFWPEQWQAGLVFVLFGFLVLAPVTIWGIQARRNIFRQFPASK